MAQNIQVNSQRPEAIPETAFHDSVNEQGLDLEKAREEDNSNPTSELACVRIYIGNIFMIMKAPANSKVFL